MGKLISIVVLVMGVFSSLAFAKTVTYELTIEKKPVNLSGKKTVDFALMVNGQIPAPTLEFTEGDEAVITVHNRLENEEVSLHWHGVLLPPLMDGVPYLNTPPIYAGEDYTFRFKIRQNGTYWYHSHTMVQEQKGVYGAIVIHPKKPIVKADKDLVVVLSDWSDENADQIMKNLKKDGDYYLYKKDSIRSYWGAFRAGSLWGQLSNEWSRMGGMDLSDVGYDAFLINGKRGPQLVEAKPGERVRVRIINASASSFFYVSLGDQPMQVIAADGVDIEPTMANELLMGMAETYDVLFTVPDHKNYELRATSQDGTGQASGWIGKGAKVYAREKTKPGLYSTMDHMNHGDDMSHENHMSHMDHDNNMSHENHMNHAGHEGHKMAKAIDSLTVDDLKSKTSTAFAKDRHVYDLKLVLGGSMERYVWHINGKAIHQDRDINVKEGDIVRFTFVNETMMHHPMHLHGHFFRVINKYGQYSPLKHTVDVPPHGERTIEFDANEPGQWMLHCHNLYHMKSGMARVVKYMSYTPTGEMAEFDKMDPHRHEHLYYDGRLEAATNHAQADFRVSRTWDALEVKAETREYDDFDHSEADVLYRRWVSNYLSFVGGGVYFSEYDKDEARGVLGVSYIFPLLLEAQLFVDHRGEFRLDLERKFQWTKYIYSDGHLALRENQDHEFEVTLMYAQNWTWAVGLMLTEDRGGVGAQYRF